MKNKIPILLITHDRPYLLGKVLDRLIKFTDWNEFELWICSNSSTISNQKIIKAYKSKFPFINVFHQEVNQVALIQNSLIEKLRRDIYIKLDDDIFVTDNWSKSFLNVYERNYTNISIGSVIIPINGFGWTIFLKIMNLEEDFILRFPDVKLIQGCTEPAIWDNPEVNEYFWSKCLDLDSTAKHFLKSQKSYNDYEVPYRYSIGGIIFSHEFWEKMNGWKVSEEFSKGLRNYKLLSKVNKKIANLRGKPEQKRVQQLIKLFTGMETSELGYDEQSLFTFSQENGYKQYVTTENIIFHFAFGPTEEYLIKKVFLDIKF